MGAGPSTLASGLPSDLPALGKFQLTPEQQKQNIVLSNLLRRLLETNNLVDLESFSTEDRCSKMIAVVSSQINREFQSLRFPDPLNPTQLRTTSFVGKDEYDRLVKSGSLKDVCNKIAEFLVRYVLLISTLSMSISVPTGIPKLMDQENLIAQPVGLDTQAISPVPSDIFQIVLKSLGLSIDKTVAKNTYMFSGRDEDKYLINTYGYIYDNVTAPAKARVMTMTFQYYYYGDLTNPDPQATKKGFHSRSPHVIKEQDKHTYLQQQQHQQQQQQRFQVQGFPVQGFPVQGFQGQGQGFPVQGPVQGQGLRTGGGKTSKSRKAYRMQRKHTRRFIGGNGNAEKEAEAAQAAAAQAAQAAAAEKAAGPESSETRSSAASTSAAATAATSSSTGTPSPAPASAATSSPVVTSSAQTQLRPEDEIAYFMVQFKNSKNTESLGEWVFNSDGKCVRKTAFDASMTTHNKYDLSASSDKKEFLSIILESIEKISGEDKMIATQTRFDNIDTQTTAFDIQTHVNRLKEYTKVDPSYIQSPAALRAYLLLSEISVDKPGSVKTSFCKDPWAMLDLGSSKIPAYSLMDALYVNQQEKSLFLQKLMESSYVKKKSQSAAPSFNSLYFPKAEGGTLQAFCDSKQNPDSSVESKKTYERKILAEGYRKLRDAYNRHVQAVFAFLTSILVVDQQFIDAIQVQGQMDTSSLIRLHPYFMMHPQGSLDALNRKISEACTILSTHYLEVEKIYNETLKTFSNPSGKNVA